jgi:hypothetical protein
MPTTTLINKLDPKKEKEFEKERKIQNTAWEDLNMEQKIERTRSVLKGLSRELNYKLPKMDVSIRKLEKHSHKDDGDIVIPLGSDSPLGESEQGAKNPEGKEWF